MHGFQQFYKRELIKWGVPLYSTLLLWHPQIKSQVQIISRVYVCVTKKENPELWTSCIDILVPTTRNGKSVVKLQTLHDIPTSYTEKATMKLFRSGSDDYGNSGGTATNHTSFMKIFSHAIHRSDLHRNVTKKKDVRNPFCLEDKTSMLMSNKIKVNVHLHKVVCLGTDIIGHLENVFCNGLNM